MKKLIRSTWFIPLLIVLCGGGWSLYKGTVCEGGLGCLGYVLLLFLFIGIGVALFISLIVFKKTNSFIKSLTAFILTVLVLVGIFRLFVWFENSQANQPYMPSPVEVTPKQPSPVKPIQ